MLVIYEEGESDNRTSIFKFLKANAKTHEFSQLEGEKLKNWAKKEIERYGGSISIRGLERLVDYVGSDLWQLANEIQKLVNFKNKGNIEEKDIDLLVKPNIETNIFKTIDAVALKNKKQALSFLHEHLDSGENPVYILAMITYQFRNLLIIKELMEKKQPYYAILKITKLNPFVVKKSYQQAARFSFGELKKIYQKIFQIDLAVKTGKNEPKTDLD